MRTVMRPIVVGTMLLAAASPGCNNAARNAQIGQLVDSLASDQKAVRVEALKQLKSTGRSCIPSLIELLNDEEQRLRRWGKTPAFGWGISTEEGRPPEAFQLLRHFARDQGRRPILQEKLSDGLVDPNDKIRGWFNGALYQRQTGSPPDNIVSEDSTDWVPQLRHEDVNVRRWAAFCLSRATRGPDATPALCESAEDEDVLVRLHSIKAIGSWGSRSDAVLPVLNEAIVDSHPAVRWEALWAIRQLWHGPRHEVPNLAVALQDDDLGVQGQALIAIAGFGATETEMPILLKALEQTSDDYWYSTGADDERTRNDEDVYGEGGSRHSAHIWLPIQVSVSKSLGRLGPKASAAVPALREKLDSSDERLALAAALALTNIAPHTSGVMELIEECVDAKNDSSESDSYDAHEKASLRQEAFEGISNIGGEHAIRILVFALTDDDEVVRNDAPELLVDAFRATDLANVELVGDAIDALLNAATSEHRERLNAMGQLGRLYSVAPIARQVSDHKSKVIERIVQALSSGADRSVRGDALNALNQMGELNDSDRHKVIEALASSESRSLRAAAEAFEFRTDSPGRIPELINDLDAEDVGQWRAAAVALGRIGPEAADAAGKLAERDALGNDFVLVSQLFALARIDPTNYPPSDAAVKMTDALEPHLTDFRNGPHQFSMVLVDGMRLLAELGPDAEAAAVPFFAEVLNVAEVPGGLGEVLGVVAAESLGEFRTESEMVAAVLRSALLSPHLRVRRSAEKALSDSELTAE